MAGSRLRSAARVDKYPSQSLISKGSRVSTSKFPKSKLKSLARMLRALNCWELTITYKRGGSETFKGIAQFDMQRLGNGWHLIRWTDQEGVEGFATHRLPLADAPHGYEIFQKKTDGAIKVLLQP